jgi:hypothetical protein
MDTLFDPDENFGGQFQAYCDKCGRYYATSTPHMCYPDDINVENERRKLKRFLKEFDIHE